MTIFGVICFLVQMPGYKILHIRDAIAYIRFSSYYDLYLRCNYSLEIFGNTVNIGNATFYPFNAF